MKKLFLILFFAAMSLAGYSQTIDSNSGLVKDKNTDPPRTGLFGGNKYVPASRITPKPTANGVILGKSGSNWGEVSDPFTYMGFVSGSVVDTCDASGLVVVSDEFESSSYQLLVTPESSIGLHPTITSKTDSSFTVKFWLNDTAANSKPVMFDYLIKQN